MFDRYERKEINRKITDIFEHLGAAGFNCLDEKKENVHYRWHLESVRFPSPVNNCRNAYETIALAKNYVLRFSSSPDYSDEKYAKLVTLALAQLDNLNQALKDQEQTLIQNELSEIKNNQTKILEVLDSKVNNKDLTKLKEEIQTLRSCIPVPHSYFRELTQITTQLQALEAALIEMRAETKSEKKTENKDSSHKGFSKFF